MLIGYPSEVATRLAEQVQALMSPCPTCGGNATDMTLMLAERVPLTMFPWDILKFVLKCPTCHDQHTIRRRMKGDQLC